MIDKFDIYKGIYPGRLIEREIHKRGISQGGFALRIQVYPQTLNAIVKGKRKITPELSIKLGHELGFDESFFQMLQAYHDVQECQKENIKHIVPPKLRPILFWDTDFTRIDWDKQKKAIIERVLEKGNEQEKEEIERYYGKDIIDKYYQPRPSYRLYSIAHERKTTV